MVKKIRILLCTVAVIFAVLCPVLEAQTFFPRRNAAPQRQITVPLPEPAPEPEYSPQPSYAPSYTPSNIPTPTIYPNTAGSGELNIPTLMPHMITLADRYGIWQCVAVVCFIFLLRYLWAERQVKQDGTKFLQSHLNDITRETNRDIVHLKSVYQQLYTGLQQDVQISQRLSAVMDTQFRLLTEAIIEINTKLDKLLEK
jgi:hypothetical protein